MVHCGILCFQLKKNFVEFAGDFVIQVSFLVVQFVAKNLKCRLNKLEDLDKE